jgi:hypothetical protein
MGYDIAKEREVAKGYITPVFPMFGANHMWTARQNLEYVALLYNLPKQEMMKRIGDVVRRVGLEERVDEIVAKYSSGMRVRLTLAMGLMIDNPVYLMDQHPENKVHRIAGLLGNGIEVVRVLPERIFRLPGQIVDLRWQSQFLARGDAPSAKANAQFGAAVAAIEGGPDPAGDLVRNGDAQLPLALKLLALHRRGQGVDHLGNLSRREGRRLGRLDVPVNAEAGGHVSQNVNVARGYAAAGLDQFAKIHEPLLRFSLQGSGFRGESARLQEFKA